MDFYLVLNKMHKCSGHLLYSTCIVHGYFHALFRLLATGTKGRKNPGANIFVYTDIQQNNLTLWFTGYMVYREKLNGVLDMIINDM